MRIKTLIIGASINPERYSYKAAEKLLQHNHEIYMIGNREGSLFEHQIVKGMPLYDDVDTVTLYVSAKHQVSYYDYIIYLKPRRVIFNPGTENHELEALLKKHHIAYESSCTLVLLSLSAY